MAAFAQCFRCGLLNKFNSLYLVPKQDVLNTFHSTRLTIIGVRSIKSQAVDPKLIEQASLVDDTEQLTEEDRNEEIEMMRNKSRLYPAHRNLLNDEIPYTETKAWFHDTVKYRRKMYARFGEASQVNPGIMWPTREELKEIKEYEAFAYDKSIQELVKESSEKRMAKEALEKAREDDITKKLGKLDQWKSELQARAAKKLAEAQAAKDKKDRLMEEVRRHFGFKVDPREERFKEMVEQKEKAEKKLLKEAKKKAKEEKILAKLLEIPNDLKKKNE